MEERDKRSRFEIWMERVDRELADELGGLTNEDLPDCCYADWHADGVSPKRAAKRAISRAKKSFTW